MNIKENSRAWGLVGGLAVSVAAGFVSENFFGPASGFITGLLVEIIALIVVIWSKIDDVKGGLNDVESRIKESEERIVEKVDEALYQLNLSSKIAELDDPTFTDQYKILMYKLQELAEGRYELNSLESVYEEDIRSIIRLGSGEPLRSTCPLAPTKEGLKDQITNHSYLAAMRSHIEAKQRGIEVTRIYSCSERSMLEQAVLHAHLRELAEAKINVRMIFFGDPKFKQSKSIDMDFVIFGEKKVSIGKVDPRDGTVSGASIFTDTRTVQKNIRDFEKLLRISEPLGESEGGAPATSN